METIREDVARAVAATYSFNKLLMLFQTRRLPAAAVVLLMADSISMPVILPEHFV